MQGGPIENITHDLVSLAQRGATILDPRKSWLPLLQCLLKLNSHGMYVLHYFTSLTGHEKFLDIILSSCTF